MLRELFKFKGVEGNDSEREVMLKDGKQQLASSKE
jgi:hypothetical protein